MANADQPDLLSKTHRYFFVVKAAREIVAGDETLKKQDPSTVPDDAKRAFLVCLQYLQDVLEDEFRSNTALDYKNFDPFGKKDVFETSYDPLSIRDNRDIVDGARKVIFAHAGAVHTFSLMSQLESRLVVNYSMRDALPKDLAMMSMERVMEALNKDLNYLFSCNSLMNKETESTEEKATIRVIADKMERLKEMLSFIKKSFADEAFVLYAHMLLVVKESPQRAKDIQILDVAQRFNAKMRGESIHTKLQKMVDQIDLINWKDKKSGDSFLKWAETARDEIADIGTVKSRVEPTYDVSKESTFSPVLPSFSLILMSGRTGQSLAELGEEKSFDFDL